MTSKNSLLNEKDAKPFLLKPVGKDYLWGGRRLNDDYSKGIDLFPLAETWECSTHPDGPSRVAGGSFDGLLLSEVLELHPEYLGTHPGTGISVGNRSAASCGGELPIMVKLIDADKDLSVQVHPDDAYAAAHENGQLGKTEMWYVLDAAPGATLIYGLRSSVDKELFRKSLLDGTVEKYLRKVEIRKGDVFYIEAGTIHAIGAGALIAEIQESSNLTYRLYDYDRTDKDGKKRPLHIDRALEVADLSGGEEPRRPMRVLRYQKGCASEFLCRCKYFQVERILLNTERYREMMDFRTSGLSFGVLLCVDGCGALFFGGESLPFFQGDCIFVPANSVQIKIHGKAQLLKVSC